MTDIQTRWNNLEGPNGPMTPAEKAHALKWEGWNPQEIAKLRAEMEAKEQGK